MRSLNGRGLGRCGKAVPEDTNLEDRIERLIGGTVESAGFRLVRVKMFTRSKRVLQIMIEREDGEAATVDDCAMVSRLVGLHLDDGDPISGAYDLEVSSTTASTGPWSGGRTSAALPGSRPWRRSIRRSTDSGVFRGRLGGLSDGGVCMERTRGDVVVLPFERIVDARLVLNDELMRGKTE